MTAPNHLVGGFTFTGIFGSLLGINILSDYRLLPVIFIACLLPDIDHTKSLIGKVFLPISKSINRRYGHRTITHSLIAVVSSTLLIATVQRNYFPGIKISQVFALAYSSHLLLDMITVQGIPLFYPFKKNPCVIPGRPDLRIRSGNVRHEAICMCLFTVSAVFMQPLMADGFWTSYNRLFGTLSHVVSEYNKSSDLLEVSFTVQHASKVYNETGYCISVNDSKITLLGENNHFMTYPKEGQLVTDFYPSPTDIQYNFQEGQFYNIGIDSLIGLFNSDKYPRFQLQGSKPFIYYQNGIEHQKTLIELEYANALHIKEITESIDINFNQSPTIVTKQQQLARLIESKVQKEIDYQNEMINYNSVKSAAEAATDHVEKEILMIEFAKMKVPKAPSDASGKIAALEADIRNLKQIDRIKYSEAKEAAVVEPLQFSGSYEKLVIEEIVLTNK